MHELIEKLENWLKAPVYYEGVQLYEMHGKSKLLKRMFSKGSDDYNFHVLHRELESLLDDARKKQAELDDKTPHFIKDLRNDTKRLMDERVILKEQARQVISQGETSGERLKEIAFRLAFGIKKDLDRKFSMIEFWERNGFLPEMQQHKQRNVAELVKRRNTLRTYVSRAKDPEKLKEWKKELEEIEIALKDAQTNS